MTPAFPGHVFTAQLAGSGGGLMLAVLFNTAAASSAEYKILSKKMSASVPAAVCLLTGSLWIISQSVTQDKTLVSLRPVKVNWSLVEPAVELQFISTYPFRNDIAQFKSPTPRRSTPVNLHGVWGLLPEGDAFSSDTVKELIREGADCLLVNSEFPGVKTELRQRCMEFGIPGVFNDILLKPDGSEMQFEKVMQVYRSRTLYSGSNGTFEKAVSGLFTLVLLLTFAHLLQRRRTLYQLIVRKTV